MNTKTVLATTLIAISIVTTCSSADTQVATKQPEDPYNLGLLYDSGNGVTKDHKLAIKYFSSAATNGDVRGMNIMGVIYETGCYEDIGIAKDVTKAAKYYSDSANANDAEGCWRLGQLYMDGNGIEKSTDKAEELFFKSIKLGNPTSKHLLASIYLNKSEKLGQHKESQKKQLHEDAEKLLREAIEEGYLEAYCKLANMIKQGLATPRNGESEESLLQEAANEGYTKAHHLLGELEYNAAEELNKSNLELGSCVDSLLGLKGDIALAGSARIAEKYIKAATQYAKAGKKGQSTSFLNAGLSLEKAADRFLVLGTIKPNSNYKTMGDQTLVSAINSYVAAAKSDLKCVKEGIFLHNYKGWMLESLTRLSDLGYTEACLRLGNIYEYGYSVTPSNQLATILYAKAESQGSQEATEALARTCKCKLGKFVGYEFGQCLNKDDFCIEKKGKGLYSVVSMPKQFRSFEKFIAIFGLRKSHQIYKISLDGESSSTNKKEFLSVKKILDDKYLPLGAASIFKDEETGLTASYIFQDATISLVLTGSKKANWYQPLKLEAVHRSLASRENEEFEEDQKANSNAEVL